MASNSSNDDHHQQPARGRGHRGRVLGGIVGGAVAIAVPAVIEARADGEAAQAAERAKWLTHGQEWEARYRQMYPIRGVD